MRIRKEQMDVFELHMMRNYEKRVLRTIAKTYPERYERDGEDRICALIQAGVRKGERYGITDDDDAERYILMLVEHGADFEKKPEMAECLGILEEKELPGDAKVSLIRRRLQSEGG
ncbi:MAG: hypothetical protein V2B19_13595 [Pseudomonadota bacterium]